MPFTDEEILEDIVEAQRLPLDREEFHHGARYNTRIYTLTPKPQRPKRSIEQLRKAWAKYAKKWREENREKYRDIRRRIYAKAPEKAARHSKKWREKNLEHVREVERDRYWSDPEHARALARVRGRRYRARLRLRRWVLLGLLASADASRGKRNASIRAWRQSHPDAYRRIRTKRLDSERPLNRVRRRRWKDRRLLRKCALAALILHAAPTLEHA